MNDKLTILCGADVAKTIKTFAAASLPIETGGLLLGWWEPGIVVLKDAIEVADPNATIDAWSRRQEAAQKRLDEAIAEHAHPWLGYVGDWHSHTKSCPPSSTDILTITATSLQFHEPIVLLVHTAPNTFEARAAHGGQPRDARLDMLTRHRP